MIAFITTAACSVTFIAGIFLYSAISTRRWKAHLWGVAGYLALGAALSDNGKQFTTLEMCGIVIPSLALSAAVATAILYVVIASTHAITFTIALICGGLVIAGSPAGTNHEWASIAFVCVLLFGEKAWGHLRERE